MFTEDEVLAVIEKTVKFFKEHAKSRQRLSQLVEEVGKNRFLKEIVV